MFSVGSIRATPWGFVVFVYGDTPSPEHILSVCTRVTRFFEKLRSFDDNAEEQTL